MLDSAELPTPSFSTSVDTEVKHNPLNLTPREIQTARLLAEGYTNGVIGTALGVSQHTAKFHVASLMKKLGVSTRTEVAVICLKAGY